MDKHSNILGITVWIDSPNYSDQNAAHRSQMLYQPLALAAFCIVYLPIGLILYGVNLFRRGWRWRGRLIMGLSGIFLILDIATLNSIQLQFYRLISFVLALNIFALERPHFKQAIRDGWQPAPWWIPFCFLTLIFLVKFVLQLLNVFMM